MNADLNWSDLELLSLLTRHGTLTAAARILGIDQTTAARRLDRIEHKLAERLFDRIDGRLVPSPALQDIRPILDTLAETASLCRTRLAKTQAELAGRVKVSSVGFVVARILAPALHRLAAIHPQIAIDFDTEDRSVSVQRREADIAVRLGRPASDDDALVRRLIDLPFRLFEPVTGGRRGLAGYADDLAHLPEQQTLARSLKHLPVMVTCNRIEVLVESAVSLGLSVMLPEIVGNKDPRLVPSALIPEPVLRPVFCLVHPERRSMPSVSAAFEWIDQAMHDALS